MVQNIKDIFPLKETGGGKAYEWTQQDVSVESIKFQPYYGSMSVLSPSYTMMSQPVVSPDGLTLNVSSLDATLVFGLTFLFHNTNKYSGKKWLLVTPTVEATETGDSSYVITDAGLQNGIMMLAGTPGLYTLGGGVIDPNYIFGETVFLEFDFDNDILRVVTSNVDTNQTVDWTDKALAALISTNRPTNTLTLSTDPQNLGSFTPSEGATPMESAFIALPEGAKEGDYLKVVTTAAYFPYKEAVYYNGDVFKISNIETGELFSIYSKENLSVSTDDVDNKVPLAGGIITPDQMPKLSNVITWLDDEISKRANSNDVILLSTKGQAHGVASLDGNGKVPAEQLPSYVDDVVEYANRAAFPVTGESGKIYIAIDTNVSWRWTGSTYIDIKSGGTSDDVVNSSDVSGGTVSDALDSVNRASHIGLLSSVRAALDDLYPTKKWIGDTDVGNPILVSSFRSGDIHPIDHHNFVIFNNPALSFELYSFDVGTGNWTLSDTYAQPAGKRINGFNVWPDGKLAYIAQDSGAITLSLNFLQITDGLFTASTLSNNITLQDADHTALNPASIHILSDDRFVIMKHRRGDAGADMYFAQFYGTSVDLTSGPSFQPVPRHFTGTIVDARTVAKDIFYVKAENKHRLFRIIDGVLYESTIFHDLMGTLPDKGLYGRDHTFIEDNKLKVKRQLWNENGTFSTVYESARVLPTGTQAPIPVGNDHILFHRKSSGSNILQLVKMESETMSRAAYVSNADPTDLSTLAASIDSIRDALVAAGIMESNV